jgi:hypothetical protein
MKRQGGHTMKLAWLGVVVGILVAGRARADFTFGTPQNLGPVVNTSAGEVAICVSSDGLEMYITSDRAGGSGGYDLWASARASINDPWDWPVNLGTLVNTERQEFSPALSSDGLTLCFASDRPGGFGSFDIWTTTRTSKTEPWGLPENLDAPVNTLRYEGTPAISADGLQLIIHVVDQGENGQLYESTRAHVGDPWSPPVRMGAPINLAPGASMESYPCLSPDGLALFFSSVRAGGVGTALDLWVVTRTSPDAPWGRCLNCAPRVINTRGAEYTPSLGADMATLYFGSARRRGCGRSDLWQAPILPIVDFNGDEAVDLLDLAMLIENWGTDNPLYDIGPAAWGDGEVDIADLKAFIAEWEKENQPVQP